MLLHRFSFCSFFLNLLTPSSTNFNTLAGNKLLSRKEVLAYNITLTDRLVKTCFTFFYGVVVLYDTYGMNRDAMNILFLLLVG